MNWLSELDDFLEALYDKRPKKTNVTVKTKKVESLRKSGFLKGLARPFLRGDMRLYEKIMNGEKGIHWKKSGIVSDENLELPLG